MLADIFEAIRSQKALVHVNPEADGTGAFAVDAQLRVSVTADAVRFGLRLGARHGSAVAEGFLGTFTRIPAQFPGALAYQVAILVAARTCTGTAL